MSEELAELLKQVSQMTIDMGYLLRQGKFEKEIRHRNRFFFSPDILEYLKTIIENASKHFMTVWEESQLVFRARRHAVLPSESHVPYLHEYKPNPYPVDQMGAPPSHFASADRLNPPGISYHYAASDKLTAVAEIRPWVGASLLRNCD